MPDEVKKEALKELGRLAACRRWRRIIRSRETTSKWLAGCPGRRRRVEKLKFPKAKEILRDHYDLQKVKDRILRLPFVRR